MKKPIIIVLSVLTLAVVSIYLLNFLPLQSEMNSVLKNDYRNQGIEVSVRYSYYVDPSVLIYDLRTVSGTNSPADVFRVLLQFAEKVKSKTFKMVELDFRGKSKFLLTGDYFQTLGQEYSFQNAVYTMRTFPAHLKTPNGIQAYSEWSGGWLGVLKQQIDDFNDFHRKWYIDAS